MKSLLRILILALLVFAGYSAFSTDNAPVVASIGPSMPQCGTVGTAAVCVPK